MAATQQCSSMWLTVGFNTVFAYIRYIFPFDLTFQWLFVSTWLLTYSRNVMFYWRPKLLSGVWECPPPPRDAGYHPLSPLLLRYPSKRVFRQTDPLHCGVQPWTVLCGAGRWAGRWPQRACDWQTLLQVQQRRNGLPRQTDAISRRGADGLLHLYTLQVSGERGLIRRPHPHNQKEEAHRKM